MKKKKVLKSAMPLNLGFIRKGYLLRNVKKDITENDDFESKYLR